DEAATAARGGGIMKMLMIFLCAATVSAATPEDAIRQNWAKGITQSSEALQRGDYKASLRISDRLIDEMEDRLGPGDAAAQTLGTVVVHKALANAGLGNQDDALWYWHTALGLFPRLDEADLSMFGAAGKLLKDHPPGVPADARSLRGDIAAPKLLKKVEPDYPRGAQEFAVCGILIVEVVIDKQGRGTAPGVRKPLPAPTLSYAALKAHRRW